MIPPVIYLDSPTETDTTQVGIVDALRAYNHPTFGYQLYRPFRNTGPSLAMANRVFVSYESGSRINAGYAADNESKIRVAGLLVSTPADDEYAWALAYGRGTVLIDDAVAANALLSCEDGNGGVTGAVDDIAISDTRRSINMVGYSITADAAWVAGDTITMFVNVV